MLSYGIIVWAFGEMITKLYFPIISIQNKCFKTTIKY